MESKSINQLRDEVFENSKSHGFHSLDAKSVDPADVFPWVSCSEVDSYSY